MSTKVVAERNETYRVPRAGKPARYVRIVRVQERGHGPPCAYIVPVSCSGEQKGPKRYVLARNAEGKATRTAPAWVEHWLTWRDNAWRLPADWTLVEGEL